MHFLESASKKRELVPKVQPYTTQKYAKEGRREGMNLEREEGGRVSVRELRGLQYIGAGLQYIGAPKFYFQDSGKD